VALTGFKRALKGEVTRSLVTAAGLLFLTGVSLAVLIGVYLAIAEATSQVPKRVAVVATTILIACWLAWVPTLTVAMKHRSGAPWWMAILIGAIVLVVSTRMLMGWLSFINSCNAGESFPLSGSSC
jgi:uncharacterized membrane protein HdeD (DUF308 family)